MCYILVPEGNRMICSRSYTEGWQNKDKNPGSLMPGRMFALSKKYLCANSGGGILSTCGQIQAGDPV